MENGFSHEAYIEYHRSLAKSHKEIKHDERRNIAFISTDHTELVAYHEGNKRVPLGEVVMNLLDLRGTLKSSGERITDEVNGGFAILVKYDYHSQDFRLMDKTFDRAKEIGLQVIARIHQDSKDFCTPLERFDASKVQHRQMGPVLTGYIGYTFTYPVTSKNTVEYNPELWQ